MTLFVTSSLLYLLISSFLLFFLYLFCSPSCCPSSFLLFFVCSFISFSFKLLSDIFRSTYYSFFSFYSYFLLSILVSSSITPFFPFLSFISSCFFCFPSPLIFFLHYPFLLKKKDISFLSLFHSFFLVLSFFLVTDDAI